MSKHSHESAKGAPTPSEVAAAIATSDDFGHEMKVRAVLEQYCGAGISHGWTYVDPVEDKPRQFDFRCGVNRSNPGYQFRFAIECKNVHPGVPVVISGTQRTRAESVHDFIESDGTTGIRTVINRARPSPLYPRGGFVGKSIVRPKINTNNSKSSRDLESEIYNRWSQAISSSTDICRVASTIAKGTNYKICTFVMPAVVVPNGTLWEAEYDDSGGLREPPRPTEATTLFLNPEIVVEPGNFWMNLSHVHFMTIDGLRKVMDNISGGYLDLAQYFPDDAEPHRPPVH